MFTYLRRLSLAVAALALAAACEPLPTQSEPQVRDGGRIGYAASSTPTAICADQRVPSGYVVVSASSTSKCPNYDPYGTPNTITIRTPASPLTICTRWPTRPLSWVTQAVPAGYVVSGASHSRACAYYDPYGTPNAITIRTPASPMTICARWPTTSLSWVNQGIPAGYVVSGASHSTACGYYDPYGTPNTITIRTPASPTTICARWPLSSLSWANQAVPAGYVVSGASHSTACGYYDPYGTPNAITIRTPTSPTTICARWPLSSLSWVNQAVPAGYVVAGTSHSTACAYYDPYGTPNAVTIRTPTSPMTICARWPLSSLSWVNQTVPAGYVVSGASHSTGCAYYDPYGTPNAITIRTPASPMTICARWPLSSLSWANQAIPAGYVVSGASHSTACAYYDPYGTPNAITIRTPASPTTICARWPLSSLSWANQAIPAGYVVSGASHSTACAYYDPYGTPNAITIRTPASPTTICTRWPLSSLSWVNQALPAGYVVTGASHSTGCAYYDPYGTPNAITIRTPASPMTICARWPTSSLSWVNQGVPAGYVKVSVSHSQGCAFYNPYGTANAFTIRKI